MVHILVRAKFADFDQFKAVFEERADLRQEHGSQGAHIFRSASDPHEVMVLMAWDDLARARAFSQSTVLREGMMQAGLMDRPDTYFLEDAGETAA